MTPKEKAQELVERGYKASGLYTKAVNIALLCVEVITEIVPYDGAEISTEYWDKVEKEIKKL